MQPLDRWVAEGWITAEGAEGIRESLQSDGARKVLRFLGMHVALSFTPGPPGTRSALRFGTVVALRTRDTFRYHQAEISRAEFNESRRIHTWLVAFAGLVPAFGAGAYLLSPQMRSCGYMVPLAFDRMLHRLPFRLYYRRRLHRFTVERAVRSLALGEHSGGAAFAAGVRGVGTPCGRQGMAARDQYGTAVVTLAARLSATREAGIDLGRSTLGQIGLGAAGMEVFRDEDIDFANRLMQAGVPVELHVYPGVFHGWDIMAPDAAVTRRATANRQAAMRRALHP